MVTAAWLGLAASGLVRQAHAEDDTLEQARAALRTGGYSVAFDLLSRLDASGSAEATRDLGQMYWAGLGTDRDRARACDLFAKSEAAGDAKATERLAICFEQGDGRPRDYDRSAELFRRAADRGASTALCRLGKQLEAGWGQPGDAAKAADLCRHGADLGDPAAQTAIGQMYLNGTGVLKDVAQGLQWLRTAASRQDPDADYLLGLLYWNGQDVDLDRRRAAELFFAAATHGNLSAPAYLAKYYYLEGFGAPQRRDEQVQIKIVQAPAVASLFWGMIAAGNDPDPDTRLQMVKHVRLITGLVPQLEAPVRAMMAAGRWPPL